MALHKPKIDFLQLDYQCNEATLKPTKSNGCSWCTHCQREVIDLRNASAEEVRAVFNEHGGALCATFNASQLKLDQPLQMPAKRHWMGAVGMSLLTLIIAPSMASGLKVKPQVEQGETTPRSAIEDKTTPGIPEPDPEERVKEFKCVRIVRVFRRQISLMNHFPFVQIRNINIKGRFRTPHCGSWRGNRD